MDVLDGYAIINLFVAIVACVLSDEKSLLALKALLFTVVVEVNLALLEPQHWVLATLLSAPHICHVAQQICFIQLRLSFHQREWPLLFLLGSLKLNLCIVSLDDLLLLGHVDHLDVLSGWD